MDAYLHKNASYIEDYQLCVNMSIKFVCFLYFITSSEFYFQTAKFTKYLTQRIEGMWGHKSGIIEEDIERRISQGFGQGSGAAYMPWIRKHDFGSKGVAKELLGIKIPRSHHLLSKMEYKAFLLFEYLGHVTDIREQFPLLDRDLVVKIAKQMGCRLPRYPLTGTIYVMSTDFLLTILTPTGLGLIAYAVKPSSELERLRVKQLLEIERRYWMIFNIEHFVITEKQLNRYCFQNLRWLRQRARQDEQTSQAELNEAFLAKLACAQWSDVSLKRLLQQIALDLGIAYESSVALFKFNTWHGKIQVDLYSRIELFTPLPILKVVRSVVA
jgi:hypothetical protein